MNFMARCPWNTSLLLSPAESHSFTTTGPCVIEDACVMSPNHPSNHNNNEYCGITVQSSGTLNVVAFHTERTWDRFRIRGSQNYHGTTGPNGVAVEAGDSMTWSSDSSVTTGGFKICLDGYTAQGRELHVHPEFG